MSSNSNPDLVRGQSGGVSSRPSVSIEYSQKNGFNFSVVADGEEVGLIQPFGSGFRVRFAQGVMPCGASFHYRFEAATVDDLAIVVCKELPDLLAQYASVVSFEMSDILTEGNGGKESGTVYIGGWYVGSYNVDWSGHVSYKVRTDCELLVDAMVCRFANRYKGASDV